MTQEEWARFIEKVHFEPNTGCWLWVGACCNKGYGQLRIGGRAGKSFKATRLSYEHHIGPLGGLCALHRCDTPACVNPGHLFAGTIADNNRDMGDKGRSYWSAKKECPHGHVYSESNTYTNPKGSRVCLECKRVKGRAYAKRKRSRDHRTPGCGTGGTRDEERIDRGQPSDRNV